MNEKMNNQAIVVENLSKQYSLGSHSALTLRETMATWFSNGKEKKQHWALSDINFEVRRGEAIGIIGGNGAGKSTLLKILSRITYPTKGRAVLQGRVSSLLEVGTGFHPELSGRENIFLNGSMLGMTRAEIKDQLDAIIDFSGVSKYIDTPIKHYSSGMYVRLAFAVAAHLNTEILLVDEVLAVGDLEFRKKCIGKMNDIRNTGRTILFVSHNMSSISDLCPKTIFLQKGKIAFFGDTTQAISKYTNPDGGDLNNDTPAIFDIVDYRSEVSQEAFFMFFKDDLENALISLSVRNEYHQKIFLSEHVKSARNVHVVIPKNDLNHGTYWISIKIKDSRSREVMHTYENILHFAISEIDPKYSFYGKEHWGILKDTIKWK